MTTHSGSVLELDGVYQSYGDTAVVKGLSFALARGSKDAAGFAATEVAVFTLAFYQE